MIPVAAQPEPAAFDAQVRQKGLAHLSQKGWLFDQPLPPRADIEPFDTPAEKLSGWPQWKDEQEKSLQHDLLTLKHLPAHEARKRVLELEKTHALCRELVWAELGESPLALAAKHLAVVAEVTKKTALAAGSVADLQAGYAHQGWRADDAVLSALKPWAGRRCPA